MNIKQLHELLNIYKSKLSSLETNTLRSIASNRSIALEYSEKMIGLTEPENLNNQYIETIANEIQTIAKLLLKERRN